MAMRGAFGSARSALDMLEADLRAREDAAAAREQQCAAREGELAQRKEAIAVREADVALLEREVARTAFDHEAERERLLTLEGQVLADGAAFMAARDTAHAQL